MPYNKALSKAAFFFVRFMPVRLIIGWVFEYMSFAIPVQKLRQTSTLLAFHHPHPAYPIHILLVPRRAVSGLETLDESDQDFMVDLFSVVQSLVNELELHERGYRLVVNGGQNQDIPQLHFHLICEV